MKTIIDQAINEAELLSIKGKNLTPFLLDKIKQITDSKSLNANIELIKNNADLGAKIALAMSELI